MKKYLLALAALVFVACGAEDPDAGTQPEDFGQVEQGLANDVGHAPKHYFDGFGMLAYHSEPTPSVTDTAEYGQGVPCFSTDSASSKHVGPWSKWTTNQSAPEFCTMPSINSSRNVYYVWSGPDAMVHHPILGDLISAKALAVAGCQWMQSEIGSGLHIHCFEGTSVPSGTYGDVVSLAPANNFGETRFTAYSQYYSIPGGAMAYSLGATTKIDLAPPHTPCSNGWSAAQCEWSVENLFEHEMLHAIGFAHSLPVADVMHASGHVPDYLQHEPLTFTEVQQISSYAPYSP